MLINNTVGGRVEQRTALLYFLITPVNYICAPALDLCLNTGILKKRVSCSLCKL